MLINDILHMVGKIENLNKLNLGETVDYKGYQLITRKHLDLHDALELEKMLILWNMENNIKPNEVVNVEGFFTLYGPEHIANNRCSFGTDEVLEETTVEETTCVEATVEFDIKLEINNIKSEMESLRDEINDIKKKLKTLGSPEMNTIAPKSDLGSKLTLDIPNRDKQEKSAYKRLSKEEHEVNNKTRPFPIPYRINKHDTKTLDKIKEAYTSHKSLRSLAEYLGITNKKASEWVLKIKRGIW